MNFKCDYPFSVSGKLLATSALEALALGLKPERLPPKPGHHMAVYLSADQRAILLPAAAKLELKPAELVEQLAYALHHFRRRGQEQSSSESSLSETERNRKYLLREITAGLDAGQITLAEASTGIGKSRILAQAADHILSSSPKAIVWVAAPTVAVMVHLLDEFRKNNPSIEPAILLGRQQFVSVFRLHEVLKELKAEGDPLVVEAEQAVLDWLNSGGKPRSEFSLRLASHVPGLAYLVEDLFEIAPFLRPELVRLTEEDDLEPAQKSLDSLLKQTAESRLVMCTHVMLLLKSVMAAPSKLESSEEPTLPFTHLLVDEVHELENAAANLQSGELSLIALRTWLRQSAFSRSGEMCDSVTQIIEVLRSNTSLRDGAMVDSAARSTIVESLKPVAATLKKGRKGDEQTRLFHLKRLEAVLQSRETRISVHFSPKRRFPTLNTGPVTVGPLLGRLWKLVKAAVGVSGTIYLPTIGGGISSGYIQGKLAVPPGRLRSVGPVVSKWVLREPLMLRPDAESRRELCYPSLASADSSEVDSASSASEDDQDSFPKGPAYECWLDAVARAIHNTSITAKGGTLVLCTSFRDVTQLKTRLSLSLGGRLICHERGLSVGSQKNAFVAARGAGLRPIWLASGGAWTGLDLADQGVSAKEDSLLTDLMILRVPIGLNRTSTQFTRRRALGYNAVVYEAGFLLKQGLGRLMRRQGLTDRRIWLLDGRIDEAVGFRSFMPFRRLFDDYPRQERFTVCVRAEARAV